MLTSPKVKMRVRESNPLYTAANNYPTHFVAVTERVDPIPPDEIFFTIERFREVYGSEITLGSKSNIERAIELGSMVRVSNVSNSNSVESWKEAIDAFRNYSDGYQLVCSHLHRHIPSINSQALIHFSAKSLCDIYKDRMYFIEIPYTNLDYKEISSIKEQISDSIGKSPYVSYFCTYLNYVVNDIPLNSDCLGSVVGLADNALNRDGAWKTFSGIQRGMITDSNGISVVPVEEDFNLEYHLDQLAKARVNSFIYKSNRERGLFSQPTLWGSYTDSDEDGAFAYNFNVRLIIYLKKQLTPILENYLEEPNTFSTWSSIATECTEFLQNLETDGAIEGYIWNGDQDANSYEELQVNNEEDVRNGIYKVHVTIYKSNPIQEIEFELVLDNQNGIILF